jgi:hypothetical protein
MSDQQLQQYAMLHKNDPYILPMAVSESNSRKQMRSEQQGLAAGQRPQPKVAEADIAGMAQQPQMAPQGMPQQPMAPQGQQLPENQGIGRLPAPNMQHMADGGIAGYGDDGSGGGMSGGPDESLVYNNEPVMRMAGGGAIRFADRGAVRGPYSDDTTMYDPATGVPITGDYTTSGEDDRTIMEKLGIFNPENRRALERSDREARMRAAGTKTGPNTVAPVVTPESAATAVDTSKAKKSGGGGAGGGSKKPAASVVQPETAAAPAAPAYAAPTSKELIDQAISGSKAMNEESATAYKPWQEKLDKENEAIAGNKDKNRGYALLAAGLGMMGGTSQYAGVNIGKGGLEGLHVYQEAEKADTAAQKANQHSQMLLMQAERAERSGNMKVAGDMQARAEQAGQFAVSSAQHAQQLKDTKEYQQGSLLNQNISARAAMKAAERPLGGGYGMNESKFQLSALTKERDDIAKQLSSKDNPMINSPKNAGEKAQLSARRDQLNAAIAQLSGVATIDQGSLTGSGSGVDISQWGKPQVIKP